MANDVSNRVALVSLATALLLSSGCGLMEDSGASPRSVLIDLLGSLASGDDRAAKTCCTEEGWGNFEADKYQQVEGFKLQQLKMDPIDAWRGHFQRLLPLKDADVEWRHFGTEYCSALVTTLDQAGEGFLFVKRDGEWKLKAYSSIGPIAPHPDKIVE